MLTDMPIENNYFQDLAVYDGCGNILLVAMLSPKLWQTDLAANTHLRQYLKQIGTVHNVDSVMVLQGIKDKNINGATYKMDVFEPQGNSDDHAPGSWSTMCGNGVRAVAAYLQDNHYSNGDVTIVSGSGTRVVKRIHPGIFQVYMGIYSQSIKDVQKYMEDGIAENTIRSELSRLLMTDHCVSLEFMKIALVGNKIGKRIDGEPHAIFIMPNMSLEQLYQVAIEHGQKITKSYSYFPQEMNANFVSITKVDFKKRILHINLCTHERNLGDDPQHCITQSCGTGSTTAGGFFFRYLPFLHDDWDIYVHNLGGVLVIQKENRKLYLTGPAKQVQEEEVDRSLINREAIPYNSQ